jgi:hypothetical protein
LPFPTWVEEHTQQQIENPVSNQAHMESSLPTPVSPAVDSATQPDSTATTEKAEVANPEETPGPVCDRKPPVWMKDYSH